MQSIFGNNHRAYSIGKSQRDDEELKKFKDVPGAGKYQVIYDTIED